MVEVLLRQKGELGADTMLCYCVPQKNILQLQPEDISWWKQNSVSDNLHSYSSSLAAPMSADPNSCQTNKYSLQRFEFSSIEFAMPLESLYLTWFVCSSFPWAHSWMHVLSAQLHPDSQICVKAQGAILFANWREGKREKCGDQTKDWSEHTLRQGWMHFF